jgi:hypothetical protein
LTILGMTLTFFFNVRDTGKGISFNLFDHSLTYLL